MALRSWYPANGSAPPYSLATSAQKLPDLARNVQGRRWPEAKLLITSPPYHNVTNYYYDQWLRLWLLGGPEHPGKHGNRYGGKFSNHEQYYQMLRQVFSRAKLILANDAILYIRTGQQKSTLHNTRAALTEIFPEKRATEIPRPLNPERQTKPYSRGGAPKQVNSEVDIILEPKDSVCRSAEAKPRPRSLKSSRRMSS